MANDWSFKFEKLRIFDTVLDHELKDESGMVGKHMRHVGTLIIIAARRQVGVDTGALKASIFKTHSREIYGQSMWIGSPLPHAYLHHEGTPPHIIRAHGHQVMRFSNGGRVVYDRQVLHPGTRANRYLSDNLILVKI